MGIKGLTQSIAENAPGSVREKALPDYAGRKVAIDASMSIYQFLIAVRQGGEQLTNEKGEVTSHLQGLFSRTIRLMEHGIKPVYVFDGKPPEMKGGELAKRKERRDKAEGDLKEAEKAGDQEAVERFQKRLVRVSPEHNAECQRLLTLMGVPWLVAPTEAEAQCAAMAKAGLVWAMASEDMDSLTFGTPRLLRHLTFSEARKMPIKQFELDQVLSGYKMDQAQFIDMCILLGCDYCDSIRGIGPMKAFQLITQYKSIDQVLKHVDKKKYQVPEEFPYEEARRLFTHPEVQVDAAQLPSLKIGEPDGDGLKAFLVDDKGFDEDRVVRATERLKATKKKRNQGRMESFFGPVTVVPNKRKAEKELAAAKAKKAAKNKKASGKGKGRMR